MIHSSLCLCMVLHALCMRMLTSTNKFIEPARTEDSYAKKNDVLQSCAYA